VGLAVAATCFSAIGQSANQGTACTAIADHELTPAESAYASGRYSRAEDLYGQDVAQKPNDLPLAAAYVQTLLHEGEFERARTQVNKMQAAAPHSAVVLTALAEVQLRQGEPWLALETLDAAAAADPCYARVHLIRSKVLRIDSMHATERAEIEKAYAIDPSDPDIRHAWLSAVHPAEEISGIAESLATMKDLDTETRQKAQTSIDEMMPLLYETSQTCKVLPTAASASLTLIPTYQDAKHVDGYKLDVDFPEGKVHLQVDTAASGMYITRALADRNGWKPGEGDPQGTVRAEKVQIGPLEFRDCLIGVSETPFAGKSDGFIGTDIFSSYLITLDQPNARLTLAPLPAAGLLPGDRSPAAKLPPELQGFIPVYHKQQYLIVPAMLDGKAKRMFVLDTGIRFSTMRPEVAHLVSTTKVNFTNPVQTVSGSTLQVYRDSFDFQLANLALNHQSHILQMDTAAIDHNSGMQIAGMLGFDMLHSFVIRLDYRDGLVKLDSADADVNSIQAGGGLRARKATPAEDCNVADDRDRPLNTTLQGRVTNLIDSAHTKPGREVTLTLVIGWQDDECLLSSGALLYGHVVASTKSPGSSGLALVFDHGDCYTGGKKPLTLRVIGLIGPPDALIALHTVLPSEVAGARSISRMAGATVMAEDLDLNPSGPPHTVHPGVVVGMPDVTLDPLGGPGCSALLTSNGKDIHLGVGAQVLLTRQSAH